MREAIIARVRTAAPGALDVAVRARDLLPVSGRRARGLRAEVQRLAEQLEAVQGDIRELRGEIDEFRADALRIAELTDIVEQRLAGTDG